MVLLALSPGTRACGVAVFRNAKLTFWQRKTFAGAWSKQKLQTITTFFSDLLDMYEVDAVVVKTPYVFPTSVAFSQVVGALNVLCEERNIKAKYYTFSDIQLHFVRTQKVSKAALWAYVYHKYPMLRYSYQKLCKSNNGYYDKLFEAVAVGHIQIRKVRQ